MKDYKNCVVLGRNTHTGEEIMFLNASMAADYVGAAKAQVYNILNKTPHYYTAKGWSFEYVDLEDLEYKHG